MVKLIILMILEVWFMEENVKISKGRVILITLLYFILDIANEIVVLIIELIKETKYLMQNGQEANIDKKISEVFEHMSYPWYANFLKIGIIILTLYLLKSQRIDFFKARYLDKASWSTIIGSIVACLSINMLLSEGVKRLYPQFMTANQVNLEGMFLNSGMLTMFLMIVILAPISEEIIIRGVFIGVLFKEKPYLGLIISSLLFTFLHGPTDVLSFVLYLVPGITLGLAYIKTNWIVTPIIIHMLFNLFGFIAII